MKELQDKLELPKAGPNKLDHWECVTFIEQLQRWRDVSKNMKGVDDSLFLSILLNHLTGHPHQLVSSKVAAIRRESLAEDGVERSPTWDELQATLQGEYFSKTPQRDNRIALKKLRWEQGSLTEFVSQFRVLLTRCQGDGQYLGISQILACDLFQGAIAQHSYATEHLRRNEGDNLKEWESIDALLKMAQSTYGHLMMHHDPNKRQRQEGGRFGSGRGDQGGRFAHGRGRGAQRSHGDRQEGQQEAPKRDLPYLSAAAKQWYQGENRCYRCGDVGHPFWRCKSERPKVAHELPGPLRSECDRGMP